MITLSEMLNKLDNYKSGTFVKAGWRRNVASAKARKQNISVEKASSGLIRTEINYENLERILNSVGRPEERKESWFEHYNKGIIQSKKNPEKKYLQAFPVPGKKIKSEILVNGIAMDPNKAYEQGYITKAALPTTDELLTFTISLDNLEYFGG